jgi:hypothetical protein
MSGQLTRDTCRLGQSRQAPGLEPPSCLAFVTVPLRHRQWARRPARHACPCATSACRVSPRRQGPWHMAISLLWYASAISLLWYARTVYRNVTPSTQGDSQAIDRISCCLPSAPPQIAPSLWPLGHGSAVDLSSRRWEGSAPYFEGPVFRF